MTCDVSPVAMFCIVFMMVHLQIPAIGKLLKSILYERNHFRRIDHGGHCQQRHLCAHPYHCCDSGVVLQKVLVALLFKFLAFQAESADNSAGDLVTLTHF